MAFWRHEDIVRLLIRQVPKTTDGQQIDLVVLAVGEQFKIAVTISFWAAVIVALPVLFYQLYAYVIPAFNPDRSARTWPLLILVPSLFICGAVFSYLVVIPAAAKFLLQFDSDLYLVQPRALDWYEFCVTMMLAMGLIFELPAAVLLLARVGHRHLEDDAHVPQARHRRARRAGRGAARRRSGLDDHGVHPAARAVRVLDRPLEDGGAEARPRKTISTR